VIATGTAARGRVVVQAQGGQDFACWDFDSYWDNQDNLLSLTIDGVSTALGVTRVPVAGKHTAGAAAAWTLQVDNSGHFARWSVVADGTTNNTYALIKIEALSPPTSF